jgi:hypothetical protein
VGYAHQQSRDSRKTCGAAVKQSNDPDTKEPVTAEASPPPRQLRHDTGPYGGRPCSRCGLVYSPKVAYVPCFVEGDTLVTWLARQSDEVVALTGLRRRERTP